MRIVTESALATVLGRLDGVPRIVVSGNFATPWEALTALDHGVAEYRLFALNAQPGFPDREGVILETPFVGGGMRGSDRCTTCRAGSRWCRACSRRRCRPMSLSSTSRCHPAARCRWARR